MRLRKTSELLNSLTRFKLAKLAKTHAIQVYRPGKTRRKTKRDLLIELKPLVTGGSSSQLLKL